MNKTNAQITARYTSQFFVVGADSVTVTADGHRRTVRIMVDGDAMVLGAVWNEASDKRVALRIRSDLGDPPVRDLLSAVLASDELCRSVRSALERVVAELDDAGAATNRVA